jgi:V8-like Glu-specific endopeptidase
MGIPGHDSGTTVIRQRGRGHIQQGVWALRRLLIALAAAALAVVVASPAKAITNGEPDGNRHPYVGLAVFDDADGPSRRCSASLLSPTVVLTAGPCTAGAVAARVWFAEDVQNNSEYPFGGATSYDGVPYT